MIVIHGKRKIRIKRYNDSNIKCEQCHCYGQIFSVYQEYFHLFFVPFFPLGYKIINSVCPHCKDSFNEEKTKHYLSLTRTPLYLYTGSILIVALVVFLIHANINTQKQKTLWVDSPEIGDVYLIRQETDNTLIYYFLKIADFKADTVELYHNVFHYNRFVSKMDEADYFVKNDTLRVSKADLKNYLKEGVINSVKRNYEQNSRFRIEKYE